MAVLTRSLFPATINQAYYLGTYKVARINILLATYLDLDRGARTQVRLLVNMRIFRYSARLPTHFALAPDRDVMNTCKSKRPAFLSDLWAN